MDKLHKKRVVVVANHLKYYGKRGLKNIVAQTILLNFKG